MDPIATLKLLLEQFAELSEKMRGNLPTYRIDIPDLLEAIDETIYNFQTWKRKGGFVPVVDVMGVKISGDVLVEMVENYLLNASEFLGYR